MTRKSSVKTLLPPALLKELDKLVMEDRLTLDELHQFVADHIENAPSRSSIGRYVSSEKETIAALRESREIARGIAQELGPGSVESEQGRILVEMLRSFVFKAMKGKINNPNAEFDAAEISKITRSVRDLAQAMNLEQDFAKRIREEERKKVEAEVMARIEQLGNASDLKKLTDKELEQKIAELSKG